jgi:Flp pilus assembly protein TadB
MLGQAACSASRLRKRRDQQSTFKHWRRKLADPGKEQTMRAVTQFVLTVVICMAWVAACYRYPAVLIASAVAFGTFLYWLSRRERL